MGTLALARLLLWPFSALPGQRASRPEYGRVARMPILVSLLCLATRSYRHNGKFKATNSLLKNSGIKPREISKDR